MRAALRLVLAAAALSVFLYNPAHAQAPGPAELGVPVYPGAKFDAAKSKGLSSASEKYYIFTSTDAPAQVIAFYERNTGKKGTVMGGATIVVLEGQPPFPKHGVLVETNRPELYPAPVKTVFTVRREVESPEDEPAPDEEPEEPADTTSSR